MKLSYRWVDAVKLYCYLKKFKIDSEKNWVDSDRKGTDINEVWQNENRIFSFAFKAIA